MMMMTNKAVAITGTLAPSIAKAPAVFGMREGLPVEKGIGMTESFLERNFDLLCQYADLWIAYPDLFIDLITPIDSNFRLYFYQRMFMRVAIRFRYSFATFTRAFSKSFLSILTMYLRCVFLPRSKLFICADVLRQAVKIAKEKLDEIWHFFPLLKQELLTHNMSQDYFTLTFYNKSVLDVVSTGTSQRGGRRHGGLIEEVATINGDELSAVVLPLMNVNRRDQKGRLNPREPHQAQIYVTTAGPKTTYAYERLIEITIMSILKPESAFVWGGSYHIPVYHELLDKNYIDEIRLSSTYKEEDFAREYMSIWTGGSKESWIDPKRINKYRKMLRAEKKSTIRVGDTSTFYIISVDVGRYVANTVIWVIKCIMEETRILKKVVYGEVLFDAHTNKQALRIKEMIRDFSPREVVIDGTGAGLTIIDAMTIPTHNYDTGEIFPGYGIINHEDYAGYYDKEAVKIIYRLIANPTLNTQIHSNFYMSLTGGSVRFLASEMVARTKLLSTKKGQKMSPVQRAKILLPYENTTRLFDEIANLRIKTTGGTNVALEKISSRLEKDRVSSLEYGLWRIKMFEDEMFRVKRRKKRDMSKFIQFTPKGN